MNSTKEPEMPLNKTRASILTHLLSEDLTALDLEEELGINESAIRRHLDTLQRQGLVKHHFEKVSRGRPKKKYKITSAGKKIFPQKTHDLFISLAKIVKGKYGDEELEDLLSKVAIEFAERLSPDDKELPVEERLEDFVGSLDEFGFYPQTWKENDVFYIEYRNCVFGDVVEEFSGELCEMHEEIVENVVPNCEVVRKSSVGMGDDICLHKIKLESSQS